MIICLLFAFGWETAVPNMPGDLSFLSIYSYLSAMANHPTTSEVRGPMSVLSGALGTGGPSESAGYPVLILLTLVMLACGALWFSHFEYLPREDAE
jgi:ABC-2 type transport system permease protein